LGLVCAASLAASGCADDTTAGTMSIGGTEGETTDTTSPSSITDSPTSPPTTDTPTTTQPVTSTDSSTTDEPTTTVAPTSTDSTTTTTTGDTDTTATTTTTDTDSTTGDPIAGRSITQTVNSGTVATSPNFRMVFTMGQPTQNQGTYTSANFRLQGGLIGANGNPP